MCDMKFSHVRKALAGVIGMMMLVIILFSAFYIAVEAEHDCTGDDCPICACIQLCINTLRGFSSGITVAISAAVPVLPILFTALIFRSVLFQETPISRKVRMNN